MRYVALVIIVLVSLATESAMARVAPHYASKSSDPINGFWYTEGHEGIVELYKCDDKFCGRFYWMKASDVKNASLDDRNPDPDKRDRPLCHLQFMGDFAPDGHGHYADGWIYSPRHGQTFSAEMTLVNHNTLTLHGYVIVPLLGEDQTWTRVSKLPVACASHS